MEIYFLGNFPYCINHALLNQAGDMLIAVGDCKEVYVYNVQNGKMNEYAIYCGNCYTKKRKSKNDKRRKSLFMFLSIFLLF